MIVEGTIAGTTILITLMVIKINWYVGKCGDDHRREWDIIEWFFVTLFGMVGVVYIILAYSHELFSFSCGPKDLTTKKKKTRKSKEPKEPKETKPDFIPSAQKTKVKKTYI